MVKVDLSQIRSTSVGCGKPNCRTGSSTLHRHHIRNERFLLRHLKKRYRKSKWYKAMRARYDEFKKEDVAVICRDHHEEVHMLYANVVFADIKSRGYKPLEDYTRTEAEQLMERIGKVFDEWFHRETPGMKARKFVP